MVDGLIQIGLISDRLELRFHTVDIVQGEIQPEPIYAEFEKTFQVPVGGVG